MVAVMKVDLIGMFSVLMGCSVTKAPPKVCFNIIIYFCLTERNDEVNFRVTLKNIENPNCFVRWQTVVKDLIL